MEGRIRDVLASLTKKCDANVLDYLALIINSSSSTIHSASDLHEQIGEHLINADEVADDRESLKFCARIVAALEKEKLLSTSSSSSSSSSASTKSAASTSSTSSSSSSSSKVFSSPVRIADIVAKNAQSQASLFTDSSSSSTTSLSSSVLSSASASTSASASSVTVSTSSSTTSSSSESETKEKKAKRKEKREKQRAQQRAAKEERDREFKGVSETEEKKKAKDNAKSTENDDDDDDDEDEDDDQDSDGSDLEDGQCLLCERFMPLTRHHIIPKTTHKHYASREGYTKKMLNTTIWVCRPCHSGIHSLIDEETMAKEYNTLDKLLKHEGVMKMASYMHKQRTRTKADSLNPKIRYAR